ncbi:MAG: aminotransferase class V-fold PLP-dependent enzyme, partial [Methanoregulaceae archaeon]|nr:aminotransferase class V-fold PLP-dependent enzyme [Methanoregulaceae archaeon]
MEESIIYLNNAATTWPKPAEVLDLVYETAHSPYLEQGRSTNQGAIDYVESTRETLARFFRFDDLQHVIFTANATDSLNLLIHGFARKNPGKFHVVTSELEHNSVLRPLTALREEGRISLSVAGASPYHVAPETIMDEVTDETRLAVISHGSNVLGSIQDIRAIGEALHEKGIFLIVDGAQSAGLVPVDLSDGSVDAFVFTGHKSLFGLPGTGGFLLRDPEAVLPVRQGGTGVDSGNLAQPDEMPLRFEAGTHNYPGIISLYAGIGFVERTGLDVIGEKCGEMTRTIIAGLLGIDTVTVDNPEPELPVISFSVKGLESEDVGFILSKAYRVIVRTGLHCAPLIHRRLNEGRGSVRISLSCMNT